MWIKADLFSCHDINPLLFSLKCNYSLILSPWSKRDQDFLRLRGVVGRQGRGHGDGGRIGKWEIDFYPADIQLLIRTSPRSFQLLLSPLRKWENLAFEGAKLEEAGKASLKSSIAGDKPKMLQATGRHPPAQRAATPDRVLQGALPPGTKTQPFPASFRNPLCTDTPKSPYTLRKSGVLHPLRWRMGLPGKSTDAFWVRATLEGNTLTSFLSHWFSPRDNSAPQGTVSNVWRHFDCHNWGRGDGGAGI